MNGDLALVASSGDDTAGAAGAGALIVFLVIVLLIVFAVLVITIVSHWKLFTKAGKPGWASIVPIYNTIVLLEIVGRPIWWVVLLFIPFVDIVVGIIVTLDLAKSFAKSTGFAVGMILLPIIFYPWLAFGSAQYGGPSVAASPTSYGAGGPGMMPPPSPMGQVAAPPPVPAPAAAPPQPPAGGTPPAPPPQA